MIEDYNSKGLHCSVEVNEDQGLFGGGGALKEKLKNIDLKVYDLEKSNFVFVDKETGAELTLSKI